MTLYVSSTFEPVCATYAAAAHTVNGMKLRNDGYCVEMLCGYLQRRSHRTLRNEEVD